MLVVRAAMAAIAIQGSVGDGRLATPGDVVPQEEPVPACPLGLDGQVGQQGRVSEGPVVADGQTEPHGHAPRGDGAARSAMSGGRRSGPTSGGMMMS